jgi:hypothetical protein
MRNFGAAILEIDLRSRIDERQVRTFAREIARRLHRCRPLLRLFAPNGEGNEIKSPWNYFAQDYGVLEFGWIKTDGAQNP